MMCANDKMQKVYLFSGILRHIQMLIVTNLHDAAYHKHNPGLFV